MDKQKIDLFYKLNKSLEKSPDNAKRYVREQNRKKQYYLLLKNALPENKLNILDKLMQNEARILEIESMNYLISGFKLGLSLALEASD